MQTKRPHFIKRLWRAFLWIIRSIGKLFSIVIMLSVLVFLIGMIVIYINSSRAPEILPDTVLVMNLSGVVADGPPMDIMSQQLLGEDIQTQQDLIRTLRKAAYDERIIGLLLKPRAYNMNLTTMLDLRDELLRFKQSGKKIFAYLTGAGMSSYLLASVADRIYMPPWASTFVRGLRAEVPFYKGLFDKLGVTPEFVAIGDYKIAPQVFTMEQMSDEFREVLNAQLDAYYVDFIQKIAESRQVSVLQAKAWIDNGLYTARGALEVGMIDDLLYESQLEERLRQELGLEEPAGDTDNANVSMNTEDEEQIDEEKITKEDETLLETVDVSQYARVDIDAPGLHTAGEKIAVVYATGTIVMGKSSPSGSQPSIGADTMTNVLASLADDDEIKGVILRIDSGGGGGLASDIIRNSVEEVLEKKPVVVSMADVAASGGYMIAIPAESIVAHPLTLTGSIGIFGGKFSLEGLTDLVGIHIETLQRGRNAGLFTTSRVHTPEEHERFRQYLQHHYNNFVEHVAQGREMTVATANEVAQGRVWLGAQAFELGLVDALGGLDTAIAIIKARLEIPEEEDVLLMPYPRAGNPVEVLMQRFRDTFVSITMPQDIQHLHAYLKDLVQLQDEWVFAWLPFKFFID